MKIEDSKVVYTIEEGPNGPIGNVAAIAHVMAWHGRGDKPSSEPVMNQFINACVCPTFLVKRIDKIWVCKNQYCQVHAQPQLTISRWYSPYPEISIFSAPAVKSITKTIDVLIMSRSKSQNTPNSNSIFLPEKEHKCMCIYLFKYIVGLNFGRISMIFFFVFLYSVLVEILA